MQKRVGNLAEALIRIGTAVVISLAIWLPIGLSLRRETKRFTGEAEDECYTLRQPRFVLGVGLVVTAVFFLFFILAVFLSDQMVGFAFLPFCVLGMSLAIYAARWKIIVMGSRLELFRPLKAPAEVALEDIQRVAQEHSGIVAYMDGKKLFTVEAWVVGFELLYNRLYELGKMESTQSRDSFQVRRSKAELVIGIVCLILFTGIMVWAILDGGATPSVFVCFLAFILLSGYLIIAPLRWKIEVTGGQLIYRKTLGREKTVPVRSIERVKIKDNAISLISNGKTIIKVAPAYKGVSILIERLHAEGIPFYQRNKLLTFEEEDL